MQEGNGLIPMATDTVSTSGDATTLPQLDPT